MILCIIQILESPAEGLNSILTVTDKLTPEEIVFLTSTAMNASAAVNSSQTFQKVHVYDVF